MFLLIGFSQRESHNLHSVTERNVSHESQSKRVDNHSPSNDHQLKDIYDKRVLTPAHFNGSFAFAAIDALVIEIDSLNGSTFAGEVDDTAAGSFREFMP